MLGSTGTASVGLDGRSPRSLMFDRRKPIDAVYIAGGLNPTVLDDVSVRLDGSK